jgi:methenyltetrahydrofolate cyclohydrolase
LLLSDLTITEFLEKTASGAPVPGGGSMAALSAAIAAALAEMVANLSMGKKGYEATGQDMTTLAEKAAFYRQKLSRDIDGDAKAFGQVMAAFRLPKQTDEDQRNRTNAIQTALKTAARLPLDVAEDALKIMDLAEEAAAKGNRNAITDALVAAMMARTAALAALYNVTVNCAAITDREFVFRTTQRVRQIESAVEAKETAIRRNAGLDER